VGVELTKVQRWLIAGGLGLAVMVVGVVYVRRSGAPGGERIVVENATPATVASTTEQRTGVIVVHVVGGVRRPGVYRLPAGARVEDAVEAAGGMLPGVQPEQVNLAASLEDGQQVYVPVAGSGGGRVPIPRPVVIPDASVPGGAAAESSSLPAVEPPGASPLAPAGLSANRGAQAPAPGTQRAPASAQTGAQPASGRTSSRGQTTSRPKGHHQGGVRFPINVNTATEMELDALPHIGPALAARIIEYRNNHGPFHNLEELGRVKGIGSKTLSDLAPYVAF
jgi:competence protein ComEA